MAKTASKPKPLSDEERAPYHGVEAVSPEALAAERLREAEADAAAPADAAAVADGPAVTAGPAETAPVQLFPLARLKLSKANVRQSGKADVERMAASIRAHGVMQNLIGTYAGEDDREIVEIVGGRRRLRALELLKRQQLIGADYLVPVQIVPADVAHESSLVENFEREQMGAGEEAVEFGKLAAAGHDAAAIAQRFGLTTIHVKQRLRLAALAAPVLAALRDRKITLEVAQAFASVPNAARQEAVWKELKGDKWALGSPDTIRRRMADKALKSGAVVARYVGAEAYQAAGGTVEVDLFTPGGEALWLDADLAQDLARAKLAAAAEEIRAADGWGRVIPYLEWSEGRDLRRDLVAYDGDEDTAEIPADLRSSLVLLITLESDGQDGWAIEMDDVYLLDASAPVESPPADDDADDDDDDDALEQEEAAPPPPEPEPEEEGLKPLSGALQDALAMRRRDLLVLALLKDTARARDVTLFLLIEEAGRSFAANQRLGSCLQATSRDRGDPIPGELPWEGDTADLLAEAIADRQEFGGREGVDAVPIDDSWRHLKSVNARFAAFIELPVEERLHWGAVALGRTLRAWGNNYSRTHAELHDAIAASLGVAGPTPDQWRPTAENYFDRAGKARCLQFLEEVFAGEFETATWAKWKNAELARGCEMLASGEPKKLGVPVSAGSPLLERAKAWMPQELLFGKVGDRG